MSHRPRVYIAEPLCVGTTLELPRNSSHHIADVLRLKAGAELDAFNGDGYTYAAKLLESGKRCRIQLLTAEVADTESPLHISLWQALSRGERMDASVRQAVELGAKAICPIVTQRCQVRLDEKRAAKRHAHWSSIIISACEQCGRATLPTLAPLTPLQQALTQREPDRCSLVLAPGASQSLGHYSPSVKPQSIDLLIGPESGLSDTEIDQAIDAGFVPLSAGSRILRTETAGPAAIAILQARFGDLT